MRVHLATSSVIKSRVSDRDWPFRRDLWFQRSRYGSRSHLSQCARGNRPRLNANALVEPLVSHARHSSRRPARHLLREPTRVVMGNRILSMSFGPQPNACQTLKEILKKVIQLTARRVSQATTMMQPIAFHPSNQRRSHPSRRPTTASVRRNTVWIAANATAMRTPGARCHALGTSNAARAVHALVPPQKGQGRPVIAANPHNEISFVTMMDVKAMPIGHPAVREDRQIRSLWSSRVNL